MPHISVCERNIFAESDAELLHRKIVFVYCSPSSRALHASSLSTRSIALLEGHQTSCSTGTIQHPARYESQLLRMDSSPPRPSLIPCTMYVPANRATH